MTFQATPYMKFNGKAAEALEFYRDVFGGSLELTRYRDMPMDEAPGDPDWVMHGALTLEGGGTLFAADGPDAPASGNVELCIWGDDAGQLEGFFTRLQEGGEVQLPFAAAPWGSYFGQVVDAYGIVWMLEGGQSA